MSRLFWVSALVLLSISCGPDEEENTYLCSDASDEEVRCASGTEYCLKVVEDDGETERSAECAALPDECSDCDCAEEDAAIQKEMECSASTVCTSLGTRITLQCIPPSN